MDLNPIGTQQITLPKGTLIEIEGCPATLEVSVCARLGRKTPDHVWVEAVPGNAVAAPLVSPIPRTGIRHDRKITKVKVEQDTLKVKARVLDLGPRETKGNQPAVPASSTLTAADRMTPEQLAYWLHGHSKLNPGTPPSAEQWALIAAHLDLCISKPQSTNMYTIGAVVAPGGR